MAELTESDGGLAPIPEPDAGACCDAGALATCCEPSAKSDCCGPDAAGTVEPVAPRSCGCS